MGSSSSKEDADDAPGHSRQNRKEIREADRLVIDATSLACPTCFETFTRSPLVLKCGHSFCRNCIKQFVQPAAQAGTNHLVCPLCLRKFPVAHRQIDPAKVAVVNFAMDNILDGLRAMACDETTDLDAVALVPTLRFENKRLRAEVQERDRAFGDLRRQLQTANRNMCILSMALGLAAGVVFNRYFAHFS